MRVKVNASAGNSVESFSGNCRYPPIPRYKYKCLL